MDQQMTPTAYAIVRALRKKNATMSVSQPVPWDQRSDEQDSEVGTWMSSIQ
jgi:hypothetical protein